MMDLTEAEHQLLVAAKLAELGKTAATSAILAEISGEQFENDRVDLAPAFVTLTERQLLRHSTTEDTYVLTDDGRVLARRLLADRWQERFGNWMLACENSAAYAEFCKRAYGTSFVQFNNVTREQWAALLDRTRLSPGNRVVDLGCGIGTQAEFLSDETGAHVTGIDFSVAAICRANERTAAKRDRLTFKLGNLDAIDLAAASFDTALAFDTLYFVEDLDAVVGATLGLLVQGGQLAAFYTQTRRDTDSSDVLAAPNTNLGRALTKHGLEFAAVDFTDGDFAFWETSLQTAIELEEEFATEGNGCLAKGRISEAQRSLYLYERKAARRYLYHAKIR